MNESYRIERLSGSNPGQEVNFNYCKPDFCTVWWERDDSTTNDEGETEYTIGVNYNNDYIYSGTSYYYSTKMGDKAMSAKLKRLADRVQMNEPTKKSDFEEFADDFDLEADF